MGFYKHLSNEQMASYIVSQFNGNRYPSSKYIQDCGVCSAKKKICKKMIILIGIQKFRKHEEQKEFYQIVWLVIDVIETKITKWQNSFNVSTQLGMQSRAKIWYLSKINGKRKCIWIPILTPVLAEGCYLIQVDLVTCDRWKLWIMQMSTNI